MTPPLAPAKDYYDGTHIVLTSPVHFARGQRVLVTPAMVQPSPPPRLSRHELVALLRGSIPDTGKTLEEYREERLKKYET